MSTYIRSRFDDIFMFCRCVCVSVFFCCRVCIKQLMLLKGFKPIISINYRNYASEFNENSFLSIENAHSRVLHMKCTFNYAESVNGITKSNHSNTLSQWECILNRMQEIDRVHFCFNLKFKCVLNVICYEIVYHLVQFIWWNSRQTDALKIAYAN